MDDFGKLAECVLQLHVLSPFMTYHRVCNKSNTTEFTLCFQRCLYCSISNFQCSFFQVAVCPFVMFLLVITLSVLLDLRLLITPCGIFKLFLIPKDIYRLLYVIFHITCHINPRRPYQPNGCIITYLSYTSMRHSLYL